MLLEQEHPRIFSNVEKGGSDAYDVLQKLCDREDALDREIDVVRLKLAMRKGEETQEMEDASGLGQMMDQVIKTDGKKRKKKRKMVRRQMTPIVSDRQIRFHYVCSGSRRIEAVYGCPVLSIYDNGDRKVTYRDTTEVISHKDMKFTAFPNGDRLQEFSDGATAYLHASVGTIEYRQADGGRIVQYRDGRREHVGTDGKVRVSLFTAADNIKRPRRK